MIEKITLTVTDKATGVNTPMEFDVPIKKISNLNHYINSLIYTTNRFDPKRKCPHCGRHVLLSDLKDYSFQCPFCDEDFYSFECPETTEPVTKEEIEDTAYEVYNYYAADFVEYGAKRSY